MKDQVPVYAVGYGSEIKNDADCQAFIQNLSSGEEYYIDTRLEETQDIGSIFQAIYSDLCWKAVKVKVTGLHFGILGCGGGGTAHGLQGGKDSHPEFREGKRIPSRN